MKIIFWGSLILIIYTYFIYPILIYILSQFYKKPVRGKYIYPKVSVIVSAYNEEKNIENKIKTLLELEYPQGRIEFLIGSDGSTDRTDEIIKKFIEIAAPYKSLRDSTGQVSSVMSRNNAEENASPRGIKFFRQEIRQGKPGMLNFLVSKAQGEILVFTDARQRLDTKAVQEIVKYFEDAKVGSVSGELHYEWEKENKTAAGLGLYWQYEKFIRKSESRMGSMLGATGALYAIRRLLFPVLPENLILDDVYIPLKIVEKGYRAIFDKRAKVYDKIFVNTSVEFLRKTRTLAGNYQLFFYLRGLFNPFKGKISWQFFSHKFLRLMVPFLLIGLLASNSLIFWKDCLPAGKEGFVAPTGLLAMTLLTSCRDCPYFYQIFLLLQVLFYFLALLGALLKRGSKFFDIPHMFCIMNIAAIVGLYQILFKKINAKWQKAG